MHGGSKFHMQLDQVGHIWEPSPYLPSILRNSQTILMRWPETLERFCSLNRKSCERLIFGENLTSQDLQEISYENQKVQVDVRGNSLRSRAMSREAPGTQKEKRVRSVKMRRDKNNLNWKHWPKSGICPTTKETSPEEYASGKFPVMMKTLTEEMSETSRKIMMLLCSCVYIYFINSGQNFCLAYWTESVEHQRCIRPKRGGVNHFYDRQHTISDCIDAS